MKKLLRLKGMLFLMAMLLGTSSAWAAGYTRTLTEELSVPGYEAKAFYDFQKNDPAVLPTDGDLRYRDGDIWGLHNFGSGGRSAVVTIPVAEGEILVIQEYDASIVTTINRGTENVALTASTGYRVFDITETADDVTFTVPRYGGIVAALVMEKDASAVMAEYTINYLLNGAGAPVKTTTGEMAVGSTVATDASFFVDNVKYFRADGEPESVTIGEANNIFDINVRLANTYSYSLVSSLGGTITTGTGLEGETVDVGYPRYALVDGTFYESAKIGDGGKQYRVSLILNADNVSATVNYSEVSGKDVVFYTEGEDIDGMTQTTAGNIPVRASNAMAATSTEDVLITTLPAGKYKFYVGMFTSKGTIPEEGVINIGIGNEVFSSKLEYVNLSETATPAEYELKKETEIKYLGTTTWADAQLDYIYIVKTGDVEEEVIYGDATIEGEWNIALNGHYLGEYSLGEFTEKFNVTLDGNVVTFQSTGSQYNAVGVFTSPTTIKFNKALVGDSEAAFVLWQAPYVNATGVEDLEDLTEEAFTATYDAEAGTITFPKNSGLRYGYFNKAGELSYWDDAFDFVSAAKAGAEEPVTTTRRWDFTAWSEATVANLIADAAESYTEGWSDIEKNGDTEPTATSKDNCFWSINTPDEIGGLSANKVLIDELKGLKFGANVNNRGLAIAVNYPVALSTYEGPAYLWLGGANKQFFTIPAVKAGSTIKMGVESHKTTDARGVDLLINGESIGKFTPTTYAENTWTVPEGEAVNIVVDNTNGCHIYFIEVEQDQDALLATVKADLETVIVAVGEIDTELYTEESVAALVVALEDAQAAQWSNDMETITEATYALLNAKAALELTEVPEPVVMTYTVNEVAGNVVFRTTEGEAEEGSTVKVPYRKYNVDENGNLYKKDATNKEYNFSFTLTAEGQVENIEYAATEVENVVFIAEGEDIEGLTPITTGNAAIRSSNSAAGYAAEDTEIVVLGAGEYTVHVVMYDATKGGGEVFTFTAGTETHELAAGENISEGEFELTLTEATAIVLAANTATNKGLDAIYVVKTGDITTGINTVGAQSENGAVYNLQGQKVMKTQKGLYIVNGKKVVVK